MAQSVESNQDGNTVKRRKLSHSGPDSPSSTGAGGRAGTSVQSEEDSESESESEVSSDGESDDSSDELDSHGEIDQEALLKALGADIGAGNTATETVEDKTETLDIQSRLREFLPKLKAANDDLDLLKQNGGLSTKILDNIEDTNGQYIEMDLGLGVLEEKKDVAYQSSDEEDMDDSGSEQGDNVSEANSQSPEHSAKPKSKDEHVLDRLMKRKSKGQVGIQEI